MAAAKKPTQTPKPISKKTTPKMPGMGPTAKVTPKTTPKPKFTMPTVAEYRKSAAYRTNSQSYKDYVFTAKEVYDAKYKKKTR
jgi:hypothetical protein